MDKDSSKIKFIKEIKSLHSKEFFQTLFEYAPDPYYITDLEGNFINGNKAAERITGYQKEELVGKNFFQLNMLPSYEIPKAQQTLARNQQGFPTGPDEFTLKRKDDKEIPVEIFTYPLKIKGNPLVLAIARDISKRKRTEKDLFKRIKELNCLYNVSKILEKPNISINKTLQSIVELLPSAWQYPEFICASIQIKGQNYKTKNFQETKWKQSVPITIKNQPSGRLEVFYLKAISHPEEDPFLKEEYDLINSLAKRISQYLERKKIEEALEKSEKQFKTITENSADAIFITDQKGNYVYVNQAVVGLLGYSRHEMINKNITDISLPEEISENVRVFQRLLQREKIFKELNLIKKDGSPVPVDLNAILLPNGFVYGSCRDITQSKHAEEKIKQLNSLLKSIRNVNQLIVQEDDFKKVIQGSCQILQQNHNYLNIEIALLDEQSGKIKPVTQEGVRNSKDWEAEANNPTDAPRCIQEVIQSQKSNIIIQASREYCGSCPYYMTDLEVQYKNIFVPMLLKEHLVGIITTTVRTEHEITPEEIDLLKEVAGDLAFARDKFLADEKILSDYHLLQIAGKTAKFGGWSVNLATQTCQWSDTVADIHEMPHGYAPHVKEGIRFYAPEWQEIITKVFSNCAHKGIPYDEEMEIITGKGKRRWVRTTGTAIKDKKGEIVKVVGSFQDTSRRKKTERELQEKEILLTTVMDNLPIGIAVNTVFPSVDFLYMNHKFPRIYRARRKELSKAGTFWDVVYEDPDFRIQLKKRVEDDIASGDPRRMHWENVPVTRKGKETRYISATDIPVPEKDLVISTVMDVTDINQSQQKLRKTMNATIETISKISETRDPYTSGHQHRVHQLSVAIARELQLSQEKIEAVTIAALIHDIGKMAIPSEILTKPGKLSEIEFSLIKGHPQTGYDILKDTGFPYPMIKSILQHHERNNGSGYPNHLKRKEILLEAKIIAVADVVEAISSHRPYREALGVDAALEEIQKNRDILYDSKIVDVCIRLFREKEFKFE